MVIRAVLPPTIKEHCDAWLWTKAWLRMHTMQQQFNACFCGSPGSGKSYAALNVCELLDRGSDDVPRFDVSRVAFSAEQFFDIANDTSLPVGSAVLVDDSAIMAYSSDALKTEVKQLAKAFISMRHQRRCVLLTFPALAMLSKNVIRCLSNYIGMKNIDYRKQQSFGGVQRMQLAPKSGKIYFHRYKYIEEVFRRHLMVDIPFTYMRPPLTFDMPSAKLVEQYEVARKAAMQNLYKESKEMVSAKKESKKTFAEEYAEIKDRKGLYMDSKGKIDLAKVLLLGVSEYRAKAIKKSLDDERKGKKGV